MPACVRVRDADEQKTVNETPPPEGAEHSRAGEVSDGDVVMKRRSAEEQWEEVRDWRFTAATRLKRGDRTQWNELDSCR